MIDPKIMKLEDIAESARAIVEEGKDDDEFSNTSGDAGRQNLAQKFKKLTKPDKKKIRTKAFTEELLRLSN